VLKDNNQHSLPELAALTELDFKGQVALLNQAIDVLAKIIESDIPTAELIGYLGKKCHVLAKIDNVRDWPLLGSFLLLIFHLSGLLIVQIEDGEATITDANVEAIRDIWNLTKLTKAAVKPLLKPDEVNTATIFRGLKKIKKAFKKEDNQILIRTINKAANRPWVINKDMLSLAIRLRISNGKVISNYLRSKSSEAMNSKKLMINRIIDIAIEFSHATFFSNYFADFRARLYPYTGFLNEQSHDLARALLMLNNKSKLGANGFNWIKHAIASHYAGPTSFGVKSDKLSLRDRCTWVDSLSGQFRNYARNALTNEDWIKADSPWQFIAACIEYDKALTWAEAGNMVENYESGLVCFIDGSCNGSQHLAALTRDEVSASHVNLIARDTPGDLYAYVSAFVWRKIDMQAINLRELIPIVEQTIALRRAIREAEVNKEIAASIFREHVNQNKIAIREAAPLFWNRFESVSERRKIVKRNVMTMVYGVTRYGAGNQIMEDAPKHNITGLEYMDNSWAIQLGNLIYDTMYESMPMSTALLKVFETAGKRIGNLGKELSWTTPNGFIAIQDYSISSKFTREVPFDGKLIRAVGFDDENQIQIPSKQKSGAAPNVVHSMDAAHLMRVIDNCPGDVVTIHDSFGTVPGNMDNLFKVVREQFYELYKVNPLPGLLKQLGVDDLKIEYGNYDIAEVLNSEFSFI
jgi:DNA-directed RNA polymerase